MSKSALNFLNEQVLKDYAGSRSFNLGKEYFESDCVFGLSEYGGKVAAKVNGTHDYQVKLWAEDDDELGYDCSCPFAEEGNFCKHCVAVGLAWLVGKDSKKSSQSEKSATNLDDVKNYLRTRDKAQLVELLMQEALENEDLRGRLTLAAARSNPRGVDVEAFRKELKRVIYINDYVDYYGAYSYARNAEKVIDSVAELSEKNPETVIDLCEYALRLAEKAMNSIDDSNGEMGGILDKLQELHLEACERAKPDAEKLARRLFEWEISSDWEVFYDAAETYADVLGKKGLRLYRKLAQEEWDKLPALKPGDEKSYGGKRWRVTSMMESLARTDDDIEALVEIKTRDLSSQYNYLQIAEIYREDKQYNKALEWAERALKDFSKDKPDWRLGEFLANEYHRRGRHDEAMKIIWAQFEAAADLGRYGNLKEHAEKVSKDAWKEWREKALAHIRREIAERKKQKTDRWLFHRPADNSLLVQIFLRENLAEDAWNEANAGGCDEHLWLELAKLREKEYPTDAVKIYQDRIAPKIEETSNHAYDQAFVWIKKVQELMNRLERGEEFSDYLAQLRVNYKIKRNFIKLLNSTKW